MVEVIPAGTCRRASARRGRGDADHDRRRRPDGRRRGRALRGHRRGSARPEQRRSARASPRPSRPGDERPRGGRRRRRGRRRCWPRGASSRRTTSHCSPRSGSRASRSGRGRASRSSRPATSCSRSPTAAPGCDPRQQSPACSRRCSPSAGCQIVRSERVSDDPAARGAPRSRRRSRTRTSCITIGGVSVGDFDPVKQSLGAIRRRSRCGASRMKPGQSAGVRDAGAAGCSSALPGNPASVACVFEALVRPALRKLQGYSVLDRPRIPVSRGATRSRRARDAPIFVRVTLAWHEGTWWAREAGAQVSGHIDPAVPRARARDRARSGREPRRRRGRRSVAAPLARAGGS